MIKPIHLVMWLLLKFIKAEITWPMLLREESKSQKQQFLWGSQGLFLPFIYPLQQDITSTQEYRSTSNRNSGPSPLPLLGIVIWTAASQGPVFTTQRVPLSLFFQAPRSESKLWIKFLCCCLATDRQRPHSVYLPASIRLQPRTRFCWICIRPPETQATCTAFTPQIVFVYKIKKTHRHTIKNKNLGLLAVAHVEHGKTLNRNSGI